MDGGHDFRLESPHRASDPSLEEMLRRARDVPMGDDFETTDQQAPHRAPFQAPPPARRSGRPLPGRAVFWIGVMVGALIMYLATHAGLFGGARR